MSNSSPVALGAYTPLRYAPSSEPPPAPVAPPPPAATPSLEDASLGRGPLAPSTASFLSARGIHTTADAGAASANPVKQRLDEFYQRASPPYKLPGDKEVRAPAQFRMGGPGSFKPRFDLATLQKDLGAGHSISPGALGRVKVGKGSPEELRSVTQRLIDQGKLPPPQPGETDEKRIQRMQWGYGIGLDCSGFTRQSFLASRSKSGGAYGLNADPLNENLGGVPGSAHFRPVSPAEARAGDIVLLGPPGYENVGHKVIVADRRRADPASLPSLPPGAQAQARAFAAGAEVEVFEVDSSWGAGPEGKNGGLQRRTWLYNPTTKQWADVHPETKALLVNDKGPYGGHPLKGIYRPKGEG